MDSDIVLKKKRGGGKGLVESVKKGIVVTKIIF